MSGFAARSWLVGAVAWCSRFYCRVFPFDRGKWRVERLAERIVIASEASLHYIVRTNKDFFIEIDTSDFIQRRIFVSGTWEPHVAAVLDERLKPGDTFVDIGANVGFFTLYASQLVGPTGRICAFEPNPNVFPRLKRNVELNNFANVSMRRVALADRIGTSALFVGPPGNSGGASLRDTPGAAVQVELTTLDDALQDQGITHVAILKLDIEGAEFLALNGAITTLRQHRPEILCEVSEWSLECMGSSVDQLFRFLADLGYERRIISRIRIGTLPSGRSYRQFDAHFFPV